MVNFSERLTYGNHVYPTALFKTGDNMIVSGFEEIDEDSIFLINPMSIVVSIVNGKEATKLVPYISPKLVRSPNFVIDKLSFDSVHPITNELFEYYSKRLNESPNKPKTLKKKDMSEVIRSNTEHVTTNTESNIIHIDFRNPFMKSNSHDFDVISDLPEDDGPSAA